MANYQYDEGGNMAAYFLMTFLAIILIPLTLSISPNRATMMKNSLDSCQCRPCLEQRSRIQKHERRLFLFHEISRKTAIIIAGWVLLIFVAYKAAKAKAEHRVYDPFEILGLKSGATEKEIKSHYKKLSKVFHPDKVKPTVNHTIETIANKFVEITKAYKSLTDENIRKNWDLYGHPDGRQETSVGIALPTWIIEGKNNIWVLGFYGVVFGIALPVLVGRWWFSNRQKTKDGIHASTAAAFFKNIHEESEMDEVVGTLGYAFEWEGPSNSSATEGLNDLDCKIKALLGQKWVDLKGLAGIPEKGSGMAVERKKRALISLFAHLLRLPISNSSLRNAQISVLLQTPSLLSVLLTTTSSRNWLPPTLSIMRLHAYLTQAIPPFPQYHHLAQFPGIQPDEVQALVPGSSGEGVSLEQFVRVLEENEDGRLEDVRHAVRRWKRLELVEASFKVIGERLITPSAIVFLFVKLRLSPPTIEGAGDALSNDLNVEEIKRMAKVNDEKDYQFLVGPQDAEDLQEPYKGSALSGWAHAPYWPANRKPTWWLVLADDKTNRIVVPPVKIMDIPFTNPSSSRNYRSYKIQFQAPASVGLLTWKLCLISDTFVGEEVCKDLVLKIEDVSALHADELQGEDEISEPDEDSLAGQMAIMRGGNVKKEESDEDSSTDDGKDSSDSDSD